MPPSPPSQQEDDDPFSSLLSLESQYHSEGRALGIAEGSAAGRIEGRVFGLEKSFEKFLELGRLSGRAAVWSEREREREPSERSKASYPSTSLRSGQDSVSLEVGKESATPLSSPLPSLPLSDRLTRHVHRLVELTDANDVSRENSEDGVQDFDDRLREARAKAVLVERLVGEASGGVSAKGERGTVKRAGVKSNANAAAAAGTAKSSEMEDFGGLPRGTVGRKWK